MAPLLSLTATVPGYVEFVPVTSVVGQPVVVETETTVAIPAPGQPAPAK